MDRLLIIYQKDSMFDLWNQSQITKNEKWQFRNRAILPYSRVRDCLMLIRDYWGYLMTNNYQMKLSLFDDYFIVYLTPIIPKIQREKTKCEYSIYNLQIFNTLHEPFLTYLMIVWSLTLMIVWWWLWLFELFDAIICKMNASPEFRTTRQNLEQRT